MQAIQTRYIGHSATRPARVKAWTRAGSVTLPWNDELTIEENHARAARAMAERNGWRGDYAGGALPNETGFAFVKLDRLEHVHAAHDALSEELESDDAGNDDVRDAAVAMCDALNRFSDAPDPLRVKLE